MANACVKSLEGRSSRKVEICASGMEESHFRCKAQAWEEEADESEIADERQVSGRRPSLVASWAEEKHILVDLHKGVFVGTSTEGDIVGSIVGGSCVGLFSLSSVGKVLFSMLGTVFVSVEGMWLLSMEGILALWLFSVEGMLLRSKTLMVRHAQVVTGQVVHVQQDGPFKRTLVNEVLTGG